MVLVKFELLVCTGLQFAEPSTWKELRPFTLILLLDESSGALVTGIVKELTESAVL